MEKHGNLQLGLFVNLAAGSRVVQYEVPEN